MKQNPYRAHNVPAEHRLRECACRQESISPRPVAKRTSAVCPLVFVLLKIAFSWLRTVSVETPAAISAGRASEDSSRTRLSAGVSQ